MSPKPVTIVIRFALLNNESNQMEIRLDRTGFKKCFTRLKIKKHQK